MFSIVTFPTFNKEKAFDSKTIAYAQMAEMQLPSSGSPFPAACHWPKGRFHAGKGPRWEKWQQHSSMLRSQVPNPHSE